MKKLEAGSFYSGHITEGCRQCRYGRKMVLFITPACKMRCFYCPISEDRRKKDMFANEREVFDEQGVIDEIKISNAYGTGITGGDPLYYPLRTIHYIKLIKSAFGNKHHIHLYTITPNYKLLKKMFETGLDEARMHIPNYLWNRFEGSLYYKTIKALVEEGWLIGVEIPVLPYRENDIIKLIESLDKINVKFINLNELEFSPTNWIKMEKHSIKLRNLNSAEAKGSRETALKVVNKTEKLNISVHFCSSPFKDSVQLRRRLMLRAKMVKKPYDLITKDSTILRGIIENNTIENIEILKKLKIPSRYYEVVDEKIYIASWIISEIHKKLKGKSYIVELYPTADSLEVERMAL